MILFLCFSPRKVEEIKHLGNGLIEVDGAIDAPQFDRASAEPAVEVADDTYRVINAARTPTADLPKTITRVASTTLFSNFVGGRNHQVGLVTGTGGTLISNGITTVHTTRVFGTYVYNNGEDSYAQIVQSTAKVFEEEIYPTSVTNFGSVQHVTEKPSFGLESSNEKNLKPRNNDNALFNKGTKGLGSVQVLDSKNKEKTNRLTIGRPKKTAAIDSFKARLKNRFQRFKQKQNQLKTQGSSNFGRGSVTPVETSSVLKEIRSRSGNGRNLSGRRSRKQRPRSRSRDSRERKIDVVEEIEEETTIAAEPQKPTKSKSSRGYKFNKSRFRTRLNNRKKSTTERPIDEDILDGQPSFKVSSSVSSKRNRYGSSSGKRRGGNRFRDRISPAKTRRIEPTKDVASSFNLQRPEEPKAPSFNPIKSKLSIKKFNRFSRPDARESLLKKILGKGKGKNTISPEEAKRLKEEKLKATTKKQNIEELIKENEELQELSNNNIDSPKNSLTTTLKVSTVFPEDELDSTYLKVATIRSPYSFDLDDEGVKKSTRFITVTRTFTSSIALTTTAEVEPSVQIIEPAQASSSKPFFQTETIPAPENILTSSAFR